MRKWVRTCYFDGVHVPTVYPGEHRKLHGVVRRARFVERTARNAMLKEPAGVSIAAVSEIAFWARGTRLLALRVLSLLPPEGEGEEEGKNGQHPNQN